MPWLDLILNLVGLLLWLGWRALHLSAAATPRTVSLASTLRRAESPPSRPLLPLLWLLGLLLGRSLFYWQAGPRWEWTPTLELGAIVLPFRGHQWTHLLLFSFLSFLKLWTIFHLWLLFLAFVHRGIQAGPMQALVNAQLGILARWPRLLQLFLLPIGGILLWSSLHPALSWFGLVSPSNTGAPVWQEGLALGLAAILSCQYPALALLIIHFLNHNLYVGTISWWDYAALCGRNLLRPVAWLPLVFGRLDLRPLVGISLILLLGYYGAKGVTWLFAPS